LLQKKSSTSSTSFADFISGKIVVCEMSPGNNYCKLAFPRKNSSSSSSSNTENENNNEDTKISVSVVDRIDILGTNAAQSQDSRKFGQIPLCAVKSIVICKTSPKFEWLLGKEFEIQ
jgi:hypothetical protein